MDVEDFKKKYEQLKDNPMYKNFCSILDTKSQVLERTAKENQDLKKQLEDMTLCRDIASGHRKEVQDRETILLNQQKKFVEWLENEIALWERKTYEIAIIKDDTAVFVWKIKLELLKEVLSKYKEIVGYKE